MGIPLGGICAPPQGPQAEGTERGHWRKMGQARGGVRHGEAGEEGGHSQAV